MFKEIRVLNCCESGFWFWNREFGIFGKTWDPKTIFNAEKSILKVDEFLCFAFFREIQKGSPLRGVSLRLTVGYKKKKRTDLSASKSVFALHFLQQNPLSLFQNFNPDLPIESTQNFRAVFPIFHKFTRLFWTLLNRNKIIFIRPTAFRLFDHLIKAILGIKFLQNWLIHA